MKILTGFLFITCLFRLNGQIVDHTSGNLFAEDPAFNTWFIKKNKIRTIKGHYSTKADLDRIRDNKNIYVYEFNTNGQLIKDYKTAFSDTIVRMYEYDANHNLTLIRKTDRYGFHSYHYEYDSLNRMIRKSYRRDLNKTYNKVNFKLERSLTISEQTYSYEDTKSGTKKTYYNSVGRAFRTEWFYRDENGFLIKQEAKSITGSGTDKTEYVYNQNGLLKEKITTSFLTNNNVTRITYEYDEFENIQAQHYYRNGVYRTEYQIVYDSRTLLLSALLSRDIETNVITILKFSEYSYFD